MLSKQYQPKCVVPEGIDFKIKWRFETRVTGGGNQEDCYLTKYNGDLLVTGDPQNTAEQKSTSSSSSAARSDNGRKIGYIQCIKINCGVIMDDGLEMTEVCDEDSQEMYDLAVICEDLYENGGWEYQEMLQKDIVYVKEMYVDHSFRGLGLGLFMLNAANRVVNNSMSLTILKPFPLQFQSYWERPFEPDTTLTLRTPGDGVEPHYLEPPAPAPSVATNSAGSGSAAPTGAVPEAGIKDERNENGKRGRSTSATAADNTTEVAQPSPQLRDIRRRAAVADLEQYYGLLGYKQFSDTEYLAVWNGYELPSLQSVCPHLFR